MIAMKRFLIIFLVSVCGSLGLLAQSTTGIRTISDMRVKSQGGAPSSSATVIGGGSSSRGTYSQSGGGGGISTTAVTPLFYRPKTTTVNKTDATTPFDNTTKLTDFRNTFSGASIMATYKDAYAVLAEGNDAEVGDSPMPGTGWTPGQGRPNGPAGGQLAYTPIGDAVLPLLLMAAAYACFLLRRRTVSDRVTKAL